MDGQLAQAPDAKVGLTKPIRLVVPYAPGGDREAALHLLTAPLATRLGQPLHADYCAGAGVSLQSKADADGYAKLDYDP